MTYSGPAHGDDTEDIADDVNPSNYDEHHSKQWNMAVAQKAQELEDQMKIEENEKIRKEKEAEEKRKQKEQAKA